MIERLRTAWHKLRDAFSIERQLTDEARQGHEDWLAETDPVRPGFLDDTRGLSDR